MLHILSRIRRDFHSCPHQFTRGHRSDKHVHPRLEVLEDRTAPAAFTVTGLGDAGAGMGNNGDLRFCINGVNLSRDATNTIGFQAGLSGIIQLTGALPIISQNVTITGPGAAVITVKANAAAQNPYRVFTIAASTNAEIDSLSMTGGLVINGNGGGISNSGTLTLVGDQISNNKADLAGGGIYNNSGCVLTLTQCQVSNNTVTGAVGARVGGGIANYGSLTGDSSTISGNAADAKGGGIYNGTADTVDVNGFNVTGNQSQFGAGAYNDGTFRFHAGTFDSNAVTGLLGQGGGLFNAGWLLLDQGVLFQQNQANQGGGLYLSQTSTTTFDNAAFQFNVLVGNNPAGKGVYQQYGAQVIYQGQGLIDADDPGGLPVPGP